MFKVSRGLVPTYISHMFNTELKTNTSLRSTNANNFYRPRPNLEIFKQSISYSGPSIWNSIPKSIQNMNTIECFTSHFIRWLKSHNWFIQMHDFVDTLWTVWPLSFIMRYFHNIKCWPNSGSPPSGAIWQGSIPNLNNCIKSQTM